MQFLRLVIVLVFCLCWVAAAEGLPNSDIVLFDVSRSNGSIELSNPQVIADSPGYDSQPHFGADSETVYFTRIENDNADLWVWNSEFGARNFTQSTWSEYSPTVIPLAPKLLSTVVVEEDGTQRLWSYSPRAGFQLLFPELQPVGYHVWSGEQLAFFVLGEPHELRVGEWWSDQTTLVDSDIGRCLQKVPLRHAASFTKVENDRHRLRVYDFSDATTTSLRTLPAGVQDYLWLDEAQILTSDGTTLVRGDARGDSDWERVSLPMELKGVSRLAISKDASRIAVVYEP
jgi:hypothetical protein